MMRTKDLIEFLKAGEVYDDEDREYMEEAIKRLRAYDKLKESIEKLCCDLSSGVDK